MKNILVTAIGSAAGDITIKELHEYGYRVIGTDIYLKEWLANSFCVDCFYQVPRAAEGKAFISALSKICQRENVQYIIPLTDVEVDVLNKSREYFAQQGIRLCMPEKETVSVCRDKRRSAEVIQDVCQVISEITRNNLKSWKEFPVICKKIDGRSSCGLYRFYTAKQLFAFLEDKGEEYLVQPVIDGDIITADVLRDREHQTCVVFAREELLRTANGLGITVRVFHDECLEVLCRSIAERLNILGCVNFEFIRDKKGTYYFMECNPRLSGGVKYSVLSGYHYIVNHVRCFEGKCIDEACAPEEHTIVRKYEEYITT